MMKVITTIILDDYEHWRKSFAAGTSARQAAGWLGTNIYRGDQNPSEVTLIHEWTDVEKYTEFMSNNPILLEILKKSFLLTPLNNSGEIEMVKAMVTITVPNFEKWKPEFEAGQSSRQKSGCQETLIYRGEHNQDELTLIQTWDSTDKIKIYLNNPVYTEARRKAGVSTLHYNVLSAYDHIEKS